MLIAAYLFSTMTNKNLIFFCLFIAFSFTSYGQSNKQLNEVFKKFQEGYSKRDTAVVEKFTTDLCAKDISIVGTGEDEWIQGIDQAKNLFKNDWAYWLNLSIDTTGVELEQLDNVAFFKVRGMVSITFPNKATAYDYAMVQLQQAVNTEKTNQTKLLAYSSQASDLIQKIEAGSLELKYSIRITGALTKQNGKWQFKQLVFSFPYPLARK
jgi:hypothetical protein